MNTPTAGWSCRAGWKGSCEAFISPGDQFSFSELHLLRKLSYGQKKSLRNTQRCSQMEQALATDLPAREPLKAAAGAIHSSTDMEPAAILRTSWQVCIPAACCKNPPSPKHPCPAQPAPRDSPSCTSQPRFFLLCFSFAFATELPSQPTHGRTSSLP